LSQATIDVANQAADQLHHGSCTLDQPFGFIQRDVVLPRSDDDLRLELVRRTARITEKTPEIAEAEASLPFSNVARNRR